MFLLSFIQGLGGFSDVCVPAFAGDLVAVSWFWYQSAGFGGLEFSPLLRGVGVELWGLCELL